MFEKLFAQSVDKFSGKIQMSMIVTVRYQGIFSYVIVMISYRQNILMIFVNRFILENASETSFHKLEFTNKLLTINNISLIINEIPIMVIKEKVRMDFYEMALR